MRPNLQTIESIVEPVVTSIDCEMVSCEWAMEAGRSLLRVFIDKPGGVSLADCESLSRLLSPVLDVEELIQGRYHLEISSPGLNRPLRKKEDFQRFAGQTIQLQTKLPIEQRSRFKGKLLGIEDENILMEVDGQFYKIPYSSLDKAKIEVNWDEVFKKRKK